MVVVFAVILTVALIIRMNPPHRLHPAQKQLIHHRPGRIQNPDHLQPVICMNMPRIRQSVCAIQRVPHLNIQNPRRLGSSHQLELMIPKRPLRKLRAIPRRILPGRSHHPKPAHIIPQRQWNRLLHHRMPNHAHRLIQPDIPGRCIHMENSRQDQLHRASRRTHNRIHPLRIFVQIILKLRTHQQQHHNGGNPERQQQHIQQRIQAPLPQTRKAQLQQIHHPAPPLPFSFRVDVAPNCVRF